MNWSEEILNYWFKELEPKDWFKKSDELDQQIRSRFHDLWVSEQEHSHPKFLGSAREALAAIILFDQFPRNMFRGEAKSFSTDSKALALTEESIKKNYDKELGESEKTFMYMPLQHSEDPSIQELSVMVFTELGNEYTLSYAKEHKMIIDQFGRFPHRNKILGRESTTKETEFLKEHSGF